MSTTRSRSLLTTVLILAFIAGLFLVPSCRPAPAGGTGSDDGTGGNGAETGEGETAFFPLPPVLTADATAAGAGGSGPSATTLSEKAVAIGPFANIRGEGWVRPGLAWGWGDIDGYRQGFFTVTTGGAARAVDIPVDDQLANAYPLADGSGCVGVHYKDFTAWVHRFGEEPLLLGKAKGMSLSPSGRRILTFDSATGTVAYDVRDLVPGEVVTGVPQPQIPSLEFPYSGAGVDWVDDSVVSVRLYEPNGGPLGLPANTGALRFVNVEDGSVVGEILSQGDVLSPFPSPGGKWLAVLAIPGESAFTSPEAIYPADYGREIRVYSRSAIESLTTNPDIGQSPPPAAIFEASVGHLMGNVRWSPDGTKLAFTEGVLRPNANVEGGMALDVTQVYVAPAASFEGQALTLPGGYSWTPVEFSPRGDYLVLGGAGAAGSGLAGGAAGSSLAGSQEVAAIWNVGKGWLVAPGPGSLEVEPYGFSWLSESSFAGGNGDKSPVVTVKGGEASVVDPGWPETPWRYASEGWVALTTSLAEGGELPLFGKVAGGQWFVLYEAP